MASSPVESATHLKYRRDIDGLRAIAVLAVVAFHAFPDWFPGGFVGVDVFFVISGFLISTIIIRSLDSNSFSYKDFYTRRVMRIFPALLVVLFATAGIGWFTLLEDEYRQLGKHIFGGATFIANLVQRSESGYFDRSGETKQLLHLWSLGIEEQFYIFWPLILSLAWRRQKHFAKIIAGAGLLSFALNIASIHSAPSKVFYSPSTRTWELVIGAILACLTLRQKGRLAEPRNTDISRSLKIPMSDHSNSAPYAALCSLLGAVLIGLSFLLITKENSFPGWWALLPTTGTALLIAAGPDCWLNRALLSRRLLVWIGLISFPLYLWHWPLLSFARVIQGSQLSTLTRAGAVALAFVLSFLTYRLVEFPIRFGTRRVLKTRILIGLCVIAALLGCVIVARDGVSYRTVVKINLKRASGNDGSDRGLRQAGCGVPKDDESLFGLCARDARQAPTYAVLGDSKARAIYPALVRTSQENARWMIIAGNNLDGPSIPFLSENSADPQQQKPSLVALKAVSDDTHIRTVLIARATRLLFDLKTDVSLEDLPNSQSDAVALSGLDAALTQLIHAGKKVVLLVDNPTLPHPEDCMGRTTALHFINKILVKSVDPRCHIPLRRHLEMSAKYRDLLAALVDRHPGKVAIFDTLPYLCLGTSDDGPMCLPHKDGRLLYDYTDHISDYAAGMIGARLNEFLRRF